jgi:hypothetical protein
VQVRVRGTSPKALSPKAVVGRPFAAATKGHVISAARDGNSGIGFIRRIPVAYLRGAAQQITPGVVLVRFRSPCIHPPSPPESNLGISRNPATSIARNRSEVWNWDFEIAEREYPILAKRLNLNPLSVHHSTFGLGIQLHSVSGQDATSNVRVCCRVILSHVLESENLAKSRWRSLVLLGRK